MSIHYEQYTDTFSILNYLQNHCLWRKNGQKLVLYYLKKFQITYKIIVCGEKTVKIGTMLSRKSSKDPSRLAMCNVYIRNELTTGLPARFNAIQHKGDILPIQSCGDFYVSFVYRYCQITVILIMGKSRIPQLEPHAGKVMTSTSGISHLHLWLQFT